MSSAAITLQCPNCGGVFLTLQQSGGGMEICPHCAVAAPRGSYRRVDGEAAFPRAKTALPVRRKTLPQPMEPAPLGSVAPAPMPESWAPAPSAQPPQAAAYAPVPQPQVAATATPPPAPIPQPFPWQPQPSFAAAPTAPVLQQAPTAVMPTDPPPPAPAAASWPAAAGHLPATAPAAPAAPAEPFSPAAFAPAPAPFQAPAPSPFATTPPWKVPPSSATTAPVSSPEPTPAEPPVSTAPQVTAAPLYVPFRAATAEVQPADAKPLAAAVTSKPLPPPQIGFAPPPEPTPFKVIETAPPTKILPSPGSVGLPKVVPKERPAPLAAKTTAAPVWPGLGAEEGAAPAPPVITTPVTVLRPMGSKAPAVQAEGWLESQRPPKRFDSDEPDLPAAPRRMPWLVMLLLLPPMCGFALSAWKSAQPITILPQLAKTSPESASASTESPQAGNPAAAVIMEQTPPAPALPEPPSPATAQAPPSPADEPPTAEESAQLRATEEILKAISTAKTLEERLKWIVDGESHRASVAKFFQAHPAGFSGISMDTNVGRFSKLPSFEDAKIFVVKTTDCPAGAMLRLHDRGLHKQIEWPLFEQTYELAFDHFVSSKDIPEPQWFSMLCALSQTSGLSGPSQEAHMALMAQGSCSEQGRALLHVPRESDAGRLLKSRMSWERLYLVDMLVERVELNGKPFLFVLDCAGTGSAAQSQR